MWILLLSAALAGYGDAVDGHPSRGEREVHLWTNAVRLAPADFNADYGGGGRDCFADFLPDEVSPRAPLAFDAGLGDIARQHSQDMLQADAVDAGGGGSAMSHASSDGTTFADRVSPYYPTHTLGENVAYGFSDPYALVMAWMCSAGHRKNIQRASFVELGVGEAGTYWTQDFGGRELAPRVIHMGVHLDDAPDGTVTLVADAWQATDPVVAVLDGDPTTMSLEEGVEGNGVYSVDLEIDDGCHLYWFTSGDARFPEEGAYGFGPCLFDDATAGWSAPSTVVDTLPGVELDGDGSPTARSVLGGCDQGATGATWAGLAALLLWCRRARGPARIAAIG